MRCALGRPPRWRDPRAILGKSHSKIARGSIVHLDNPGCSATPIRPNFSSQKNHRTKFYERALPHRACEVRGIKHVIHIRNKAETYARIRGAFAHAPSKRSLMSAPWKRTQSTTIAKVLGKGTLLLETLCAVQKQIPRTRWQLTPDLESLDLQRNSNFEEDETPRRGFSARSAAWTLSQAKRLCLWCITNTAPGGLCLHPSSYTARDATSKSERQNLPTERNGAGRQGQGPKPQGRYKRCENWKHQREKTSTGQLWRDGTCTQPIATRKECGFWDQTYHRTQAEREALWTCWRIAHIDKSGRASFSADEETFSSWGGTLR